MRSFCVWLSCIGLCCPPWNPIHVRRHAISAIDRHSPPTRCIRRAFSVFSLCACMSYRLYLIPYVQMASKSDLSQRFIVFSSFVLVFFKLKSFRVRPLLAVNKTWRPLQPPPIASFPALSQPIVVHNASLNDIVL